MSRLTKQQLKFLQGAITIQECRIRSQLMSHIPSSTNPDALLCHALIGGVSDENDQAAANHLIEIDNSIITHYLGEANAIHRAKKRLQQGIYGDCIECDDSIGYQRLMAYPTAERCIHCQTLYEKAPINRNIGASRLSA
jgi:DnaK suppressor protein